LTVVRVALCAEESTHDVPSNGPYVTDATVPD
jgi:hypothetical protein